MLGGERAKQTLRKRFQWNKTPANKQKTIPILRTWKDSWSEPAPESDWCVFDMLRAKVTCFSCEQIMTSKLIAIIITASTHCHRRHGRNVALHLVCWTQATKSLEFAIKQSQHRMHTCKNIVSSMDINLNALLSWYEHCMACLAKYSVHGDSISESKCEHDVCLAFKRRFLYGRFS